jgi:segregation and condensation protein B
MSGDKEIIEAALFASGEPLDMGQLKNLVRGKNIHELMQQLMDEYAARGSALEIREMDGRFIMEVKSEFAEKVRSIAPKELRSPVLRTLAMIAYHQPITVAELVERRGPATYDHVRDLEESRFISAQPQGRTRLLQTTQRFAEYFNLESSDPEAIKRKIIELAKAQKMGLDNTLVSPYTQAEEERMQELGVLIISKGYKEKVGAYFDGRIIEVQATTFEDLITSINMLSEYGSKRKVKESIEYISEIKDEYIDKANFITAKVMPQTEMVSRMINEMGLGISSDGIKIAPDYGTSSEGKEIGGGADILIPTHKNAEMDIVKRICQRYDAVIGGLKDWGKLV